MGTLLRPKVRLVAGMIAAVTGLLCVGDAIRATEPAGRAEWRKNYRRPS